MRYLIIAITTVIVSLAMASCHKIDDDRIPPVPVYISFNSVGMWDIYGVAGATDYRYFILTPTTREPANFPYTALSQTGFGGILLVSDILGDPQAYDLACPVEVRQNVRVTVDTEKNIARCPVCHSEYDIYSNYGTPLSGPAASNGYGLQRYHVGRASGADYMLISR